MRAQNKAWHASESSAFAFAFDSIFFKRGYTIQYFLFAWHGMASEISGTAILPYEAVKSLNTMAWERGWHGLGVGFGWARKQGEHVKYT